MISNVPLNCASNVLSFMGHTPPFGFPRSFEAFLVAKFSIFESKFEAFLLQKIVRNTFFGGSRSHFLTLFPLLFLLNRLSVICNEFVAFEALWHQNHHIVLMSVLNSKCQFFKVFASEMGLFREIWL